MFLGSKFCGHCGAKTVRPDIVTADKAGACPRCKTSLSLLAIEETTLRECAGCSGVWADVETFETICADTERQSVVLGFFNAKPGNVPAPAKVNYVPCPDCRQLMNRNNFASSSGVIVDICKQHGAWFDTDELPKIIEFIRKGGLDHARKKELAKIQDERSRLRDELLEASKSSDKFGMGKLLGRDNDDFGIKGFIRTLFE
jgi:Zn-finger nucleic acid-binding protein